MEMPALVLLEDYSGDPKLYIEGLYLIFKKDFIENKLHYNNKKVSYIRFPEFDGKPYTFWHIISEGKVENERLPDLRRCERIKWPRVIIENNSDKGIKVWKNKRRNKKGKKQNRICLCLGNWEYIVVLAVRKKFLILWTAYPISTKRRKFQLRREYEESVEKQTPPERAASDAPSTAW